MTRIAIITNLIPRYREDFYQRLIQHFGSNLTIYCQDRISGMNLESIHGRLGDNVRLVHASGLKREQASWQNLPIKDLLNNHDIYFFYGNPRVVSNILWATLLRLRGKAVVIWGQFHTPAANPLFERLRLRWWRMFRYLFLYTDRDAGELRHKGFHHKTLVGMNNGLNQATIEQESALWDESRLSEWRGANRLNGRTIILSCARLEPKNLFSQALTALARIVPDNPEILWCVIGDGVEKQQLQEQARQLSLENNVLWLGAVYDESELAPWFLSAIALLHPAAIGLSLLHAYGYGLPVLTHNNLDRQMPEIAALTENNAALCFRENDTDDMAEKILWTISHQKALVSLRAEVREVARTRFNTEVMATRFMDMVRAVEQTEPNLARRGN